LSSDDEADIHVTIYRNTCRNVYCLPGFSVVS